MVSSAALEVDESLLTGEADPVHKASGQQVLSGSFVAAGSGAYRATKVGGDAYAAKLAEEAAELCEAQGPERSAEEAADLLYFAAVKLAREGASLSDVEHILDGRAMRVTRRPGNAKMPYAEKGNEPWKTGIH